jgi:dTDP-4-amino-4,6-dideoxygalactose transaminase
MALDIGPGDEVITSTYSFFATAGSIVRLGATPVLVDIDPATFNLDVSAVAAAVTPRTKAIMPVHLFGQCADMGPLIDTAARAGVSDRRRCGAGDRQHLQGTAGEAQSGRCVLFVFPSKNLGAFGDAGLVTAADDGLDDECGLAAQPRRRAAVFHRLVGGNFRLDALQAAVLRVKAPHLAAGRPGAVGNAARYRALFEAAGLLDRVTLPAESQDSLHIYNQFVVRVPERDRVKAQLAGAGIGSAHLLSGAVSPSGVFREPRVPRGCVSTRGSRRTRDPWRCRSIPNCPRLSRRTSSRRFGACCQYPPPRS